MQFSRIVMFLTVLMIGSTVVQAQSRSSAHELLELREQAAQAYRNKDADNAERLFARLIDAYPDDPESWLGLSFAYEWNGELDKAIEAGKRVQELGYVSGPNYSYRLAQLNARAGYRDEALHWLSAALEDRYEDRPDIQFDEAFSALVDDARFREFAGMLPEGDMSRTDGLRFDLEYLVQEAQRMHAKPSRPAYSTRFEDAVGELWSSFPELTDAEAVAGLMKILAILNDGHTGIYGPDQDSPLEISGKVLPLKFYWFDDGIYIVDGIGPGAEFAGSRVLKFGDLPAEEVLQRMSVYRGVDNAMTWQWMGPQFYLGQLQMLELIGATDSVDVASLTLENSEGQLSDHRFTGDYQRAQRKLRPSPAAVGEIPMYLSNVDSNYWLKSLPDSNAIYFQFNQVRNSDDLSIAEFADQLSARLAEERANVLIVDVRHNNGGNNSLVRPLIRAMVAFEQASADNRIFIITGRNTFSAAQNFINRAEQWTDAMFVGEPSASSPNFTGEETNLLLPYSRLRGSISTQHWQDSSPGDERAWIVPEIPVVPTAADYFQGRDAALEAVLQMIGDPGATTE